MPLVFGEVSLKQFGIVLTIASFLCHIGTRPNLKYIKFVHVMIYRETVDLRKPNNHAVCLNDEPSLNHDKNKNNWSILLSFEERKG